MRPVLHTEDTAFFNMAEPLVSIGQNSKTRMVLLLFMGGTQACDFLLKDESRAKTRALHTHIPSNLLRSHCRRSKHTKLQKTSAPTISFIKNKPWGKLDQCHGSREGASNCIPHDATPIENPLLQPRRSTEEKHSCYKKMPDDLGRNYLYVTVLYNTIRDHQDQQRRLSMTNKPE